MPAPRRDWKALQIPYDEIVAASEEERCYRLSDRSVKIILSQLGYAHWPTRWSRDAPFTPAERDLIDAMASLAESSLLIAQLCCEDIVMDVRQNEENPCILEKTTDGIIWTQFADLSLCVPNLRRNPNTGSLEWSVDDVTFFEFPDGPWGESKFPQFSEPPERLGTGDENRCNASANAASVLRHSYERVGDTLFEEASDQFDLFESILNTLLLYIGFQIPLLAYALEMAPLLAFQAGFDGSPFDAEDEETLKCILYDNATDTDGIVNFDYDAVQSEISDRYLEGFGMQWGLMNLMLPFIGEPGLNLAGGISGIDDADCSACLDEWCHDFDFTIDQQGWTINFGQYISGQGFASNAAGTDNLEIVSPLASRSFIPYALVLQFNGNWTGIDPAIYFGPDPDFTWGGPGTANANPILIYVTLAGGTDTKMIVNLDRNVGANQYFGGLRLTHIRIYGNDETDNPFGSNNC